MPLSFTPAERRDFGRDDALGDADGSVTQERTSFGIPALSNPNKVPIVAPVLNPASVQELTEFIASTRRARGEATTHVAL
jgi:hypothetical protein